MVQKHYYHGTKQEKLGREILLFLNWFHSGFTTNLLMRNKTCFLGELNMVYYILYFNVCYNDGIWRA